MFLDQLLALINREERRPTHWLDKPPKCEEERQMRIFNARQCLYGLDVDTLEGHLAEKGMQRAFAEMQRQQLADHAKLLEDFNTAIHVLLAP